MTGYMGYRIKTLEGVMGTIDFMDIHEAAAHAGVSKDTIKERVNIGVGGHCLKVRVDEKGWWIEKDNLDQFIADVELK